MLVAMVNLLPHLGPSDRGLALVRGLAFVPGTPVAARPAPPAPLGARDVRHRPSRGRPPGRRLTAWFRRFVETRIGGSAERCMRPRSPPGPTTPDWPE